MKQLWMDWQLFAEGESAPEGAGEGQDSTPPDAGEDFEALIRGRCKEEFDARVKKILDGRLRGLRQENQRLRQAESARQVQALERLERDAAAVRQMYPAFSPEEELLRQAMRYAAERAAGQAARSIASGGRRVRENRGGSSCVSRPDPRKLSSEELADIRRRVQSGEKIRF